MEVALAAQDCDGRLRRTKGREDAGDELERFGDERDDEEAEQFTHADTLGGVGGETRHQQPCDDCVYQRDEGGGDERDGWEGPEVDERHPHERFERTRPRELGVDTHRSWSGARLSVCPTYWDKKLRPLNQKYPMRDTTTSIYERFGGDLDPRAYLVFALATLLGLAHHVDHVIRGNHVGWPITPDINPFTYSLAIYPLVVLGFVLSLTGRGGARYWTAVMTLGAGILVFSHLSPWAVESPSDVILPYADPLWGYVAFVVLLPLIGVVLLGAGYSFVLWRRDVRRRDKGPTPRCL